MKLPWYKKILLESKKEIIQSAITALTISFLFALWYFLTGKSFQWVEISPISEPTLTVRLLSALVFLSFGRLLYELRFYYVLYIILVSFLKLKDLYHSLKKIIWYGMMFVMGFYVVPWIIDFLNKIVSIFYNLSVLAIYLFPPVGIFLSIFVLSFLISKKLPHKIQ